MARVNLENKEALKQVRKKTKGTISYRKMKGDRITATKWPQTKSNK